MRAKRVTALLMAAMMTASLAGCGAQQAAAPEAEKKEEAKSTVEATEEKADTASAESTEPEEPVKLSIMLHSVDDVPEGSVADQWVTQLEEKLNLDIEWVIPPKSAYEDNLQLTMINEDKPDVICFPTEWLTQTSFTEACESGMFYDISGSLENYPNLMAHTAQISWEALDVFNDGRVWGVPRSTVCRADGFLLREDWLKNLNIDYKEGDFMTLDEFYDMLYAFTYNDPDGNGIDDTWGLKSYALDNGGLNNVLSRIFHIGSGEAWYEMEDGTITNLKYSKDYDYYKQCLAFTNKCWESGVMEPDAFALDGAASRERNAQYGCIAEYPGNIDIYDKEDRTYVYCPGVVVDGDPIGGYTYGDHNTGIWYYYAISSTCEHPEKFLELADYVLSDEQWVNLNAKNLVDVGFTLDDAGNYDFSMYDAIKAADEKNGTSLASTQLISAFLRRSDGAEFFIAKTNPPERQKRLANLIDITFDLYWPAVDRGYKPEIATDPIFIEYKNYMVQEEAKIITGDKPVEYWDELLDGFYDAGYDKYVEEMLTYIKSFE